MGGLTLAITVNPIMPAGGGGGSGGGGGGEGGGGGASDSATSGVETFSPSPDAQHMSNEAQAPQLESLQLPQTTTLQEAVSEPSIPHEVLRELRSVMARGRQLLLRNQSSEALNLVCGMYLLG